ncbi:DUF1540 domain-containing protein [Acidaminobacterium chupaoyuni]
MTNLQCGVSNCANNAAGGCCLSSVNVNGSNACDCRETCCDSFCKQNSGATNVVGGQVHIEQSEINCTADNCQFHENGKCSASRITVMGNGADHSSQTECSSFKLRA